MVIQEVHFVLLLKIIFEKILKKIEQISQLIWVSVTFKNI